MQLGWKVRKILTPDRILSARIVTTQHNSHDQEKVSDNTGVLLGSQTAQKMRRCPREHYTKWRHQHDGVWCSSSAVPVGFNDFTTLRVPSLDFVALA